MNATSFALEVLGFQNLQIREITRMLAAILNLGNIEFAASGNGTIALIDAERLAIVAGLLHVEPAALQSALTVLTGIKKIKKNK